MTTVQTPEIPKSPEQYAAQLLAMGEYVTALRDAAVEAA